MYTGTFDTITWDKTDAALEGTSKMFKVWYAKQGSGFCGVGYWTSRWEGNGDSRCPSCRKLNKRADHLNQCTNKARTRIYCRQETDVRPKKRPEEANRSSTGKGLLHKQGE